MTQILYRDMRSRAEKITDANVKEHVLAGMALLQEKYGSDWVDHINPETLKMEDGTACVLGQVYKHEGEGDGYSYGVDVLDIEDDDEKYGFSADMETWDELQDAWMLVFTGDDRYAE